jgi:hypothetical protein
MKLCPVCKLNFNEESPEQIFCGGGHCLEAFANRPIGTSTDSCPYCSEPVSVNAVVCGKCNGILSIGSKLAIKHALATNPTLSLKDEATVKKLTDFVMQIDASLEEEEDRVSAQIEAQKLEDERLWEEYLDELSPFARFMEVNRRKVIASSVAILSAAALTFLYIPYAESNSIENHCAERFPEQPEFTICVNGYKDVERYVEGQNLRVMDKNKYNTELRSYGFGEARVFCGSVMHNRSQYRDSPGSYEPYVIGCDRYFQVVPLVHHGQ